MSLTKDFSLCTSLLDSHLLTNCYRQILQDKLADSSLQIWGLNFHREKLVLPLAYSRRELGWELFRRPVYRRLSPKSVSRLTF